jgi:hypothetical protein
MVRVLTTEREYLGGIYYQEDLSVIFFFFIFLSVSFFSKTLIPLCSFFCKGCLLYEPNFRLSLDFNLSCESRIVLNAAPKCKQAS